MARLTIAILSTKIRPLIFIQIKHTKIAQNLCDYGILHWYITVLLASHEQCQYTGIKLYFMFWHIIDANITYY